MPFLNFFHSNGGNGGYQVLSRNLLKGLEEALGEDFDANVNVIHADGMPLDDSFPGVFRKGKKLAPTSFLLAPVERLLHFYGERRIGYTMVEGTIPPPTSDEVVGGLDALAVSSPYFLKTFEAVAPKTQRLVLKGCVDGKTFFPNQGLLRRLGRKPNADAPFTFLMVGKFEVRKGSLQGIHAFLETFENHPDRTKVLLKCKFLSDVRSMSLHEIRSFLSPLFARFPMAASRVVLLDQGNLSMPALYAGADVLLYPSLAEGVGLPLLEAMSMGLPSIVAPYTALNDYADGETSVLLRDLGYAPMFDPFYGLTPDTFGEAGVVTVEQVKEGIQKAYEMSPKERAAMSQAAAEKAKSWTAYNRALELLALAA